MFDEFYKGLYMNEKLDEKEEKVDTSSKNIANYSKAQIEKRIQIKEYLR